MSFYDSDAVSSTADIEAYLLGLLTDGEFLKRDGSSLASGAAGGGGAALWDLIRAPFGSAGGIRLYEGASVFAGDGDWDGLNFTIGTGTLTKTAVRDAWGHGKTLSATSGNVGLGFWPDGLSEFQMAQDAPFTAFNTVMFSAGHTFANMTNCIIAATGNTAAGFLFTGTPGYEAWGVGPINGAGFAWVDLTDGGTGTVTPFATTITATTGVRYQVAVVHDGAGNLTAYVWGDGVYLGSDTYALDDLSAMDAHRLHTCCYGSASGGVGATFYTLAAVNEQFDPSALGAT